MAGGVCCCLQRDRRSRCVEPALVKDLQWLLKSPESEEMEGWKGGYELRWHLQGVRKDDRGKGMNKYKLMRHFWKILHRSLKLRTWKHRGVGKHRCTSSTMPPPSCSAPRGFPTHLSVRIFLLLRTRHGRYRPLLNMPFKPSFHLQPGYPATLMTQSQHQRLLSHRPVFCLWYSPLCYSSRCLLIPGMTSEKPAMTLLCWLLASMLHGPLHSAPRSFEVVFWPVTRQFYWSL